MPWKPNDGPARHTKKANTPKKKRQWSAVANNVLDRTADEGRAIRAANAAVGKRGTRFGGQAGQSNED